ncbi:hypothetical protein AX14_011895 [Amanita brunnescens Koide BX004]|nr:hypothetical protein AX14_011895 [Amanita brunnescens Koide BX004]
MSSSLVSCVSHLPLVKYILRTYEQGKASSRTISRPVIDRLPVNVNVNQFACRQLDRISSRVLQESL